MTRYIRGDAPGGVLTHRREPDGTWGLDVIRLAPGDEVPEGAVVSDELTTDVPPELPAAWAEAAASSGGVSAELLMPRHPQTRDLAGESGFDPHAHTVDQVNAWLDEHPEEIEDVLALEAAGKGRVGIIDGPHSGSVS